MLEEGCKEKKREVRIRHRIRIIKKARRVASLFYPRPAGIGERRTYNCRDRENRVHHELRSWDDVFGARDHYARRFHDTMAMCSRMCCGNPRRWSHVMSYQELKSYCSALDQCKDEEIELKPVRFRR
jgi:hypothetical protein